MYILSHTLVSGKHKDKMFEVKGGLYIELYQKSLKNSLYSYVLWILMPLNWLTIVIITISYKYSHISLKSTLKWHIWIHKEEYIICIYWSHNSSLNKL